MIEWNIQARAHACQACGRPFEDRRPYHTLLFDEKRDYRRFDVCEPCWTSQYSQGATERKGFISHWQGVYEAPPPAPPEPIRRETAETLLRRLVEQNDPQYAAARFILAVMLERKRQLKVKAQFAEAGQRVFVYEHPRTGEVFHIADPDLKLNELEAVQRQVAALLQESATTQEAAGKLAPSAEPAEAPRAGPEDSAPSAPSVAPAVAGPTSPP